MRLEKTNSEKDSKFFVIALDFYEQPIIELEPKLPTIEYLLVTVEVSNLIQLTLFTKQTFIKCFYRRLPKRLFRFEIVD